MYKWIVPQYCLYSGSVNLWLIVHILVLTPKKNGGKPSLSYQSFIKLAGQPPPPLSTMHSSLPPVGHLGNCDISEVPTIKDLGYGDAKQVHISYFRLSLFMSTEWEKLHSGWVLSFQRRWIRSIEEAGRMHERQGNFYFLAFKNEKL